MRVMDIAFCILTVNMHADQKKYNGLMEFDVNFYVKVKFLF